MSEIAIRVEGLSKQYYIGRKQENYRTLRDTLADAVVSPFRRAGKLLRGQATGAAELDEMIWALKDLSLEVKRGEVIGIIGPNGAGKSTLLKILSQITEPTAGFADVHGRVGSLLEVGTGFHPELTGRENIYLNGAILGMKKVEIKHKFDEIVDFAEIEKFIDTPVKHYSSGMYVRLAFAVAAHLEPEILLVDEVLAVGDIGFQRKCLGKMEDVSRHGRTVLLVSHNTVAIKSLCSRAVLLDAGCVAHDGSVDQVVDTYLMAGTQMSTTGLIADDAQRIGTGKAKFRSVCLTNLSGRPICQLYFGQPFRITLNFDVLLDIQDAVIQVNISTPDGTQVIYATTREGGKEPILLTEGQHTADADFDVDLLPRQYSIDLSISHSDGTTVDSIQRVLDFEVLKVGYNGGDHYHWIRPHGYVRCIARWHIEQSVNDCRVNSINSIDVST